MERKKTTQNMFEDKYPLDLEQCKKSNIMVTGVNQTGKSRLAMALNDILMKHGFQCIVIDTVGIWREKSSIPLYYTVSEVTMRYIIPETSMIFDLSELLPIYQKQWIEAFLGDFWKYRKHQKHRNHCMITLEESHLYMRNLKSMASQSLMRVMSVGANEPYRTRVMAISPSFVGLECEYRRLSQLRYAFRVGRESNTKRRFSSIYSKDWYEVASNLDVGCTIFYNNGKMKVYCVPLFYSKIKPMPYREPVKPKPKTVFQKILMRINGNSEEESDVAEEEETEEYPIFDDDFV